MHSHLRPILRKVAALARVQNNKINCRSSDKEDGGEGQGLDAVMVIMDWLVTLRFLRELY